MAASKRKDLTLYLSSFFPPRNGRTISPKEGLNFDQETLTYTTPGNVADRLVNKFVTRYSPHKFVAFDICASYGGVSLAFLDSPQVSRVYSVEFRHDRARMLRRNILAYGFGDKSVVIEGSAADVDLTGFEGCAVMMDPPWMRPETDWATSTKADYILSGMTLGGHPLSWYLDKFRGKAYLVVFHLPPGYTHDEIRSDGWTVEYDTRNGNGQIKAEYFIFICAESKPFIETNQGGLGKHLTIDPMVATSSWVDPTPSVPVSTPSVPVSTPSVPVSTPSVPVSTPLRKALPFGRAGATVPKIVTPSVPPPRSVIPSRTSRPVVSPPPAPTPKVVSPSVPVPTPQVSPPAPTPKIVPGARVYRPVVRGGLPPRPQPSAALSVKQPTAVAIEAKELESLQGATFGKFTAHLSKIRPPSQDSEEWVRSFQRYIFTVLVGFCDEDIALKAVNASNMKVWVRAFTHELFDPNPDSNYERLEIIGDAFLSSAFIKYLLATNAKITPGEITPYKQYYLSKPIQADWSRSFGFDKWIRIGNIESATGVQEDVFESFSGALVQIGDTIREGFGSELLYRLVERIFRDQVLDTEITHGTVVTQLVQLGAQMGWKQPQLGGIIETDLTDEEDGYYNTVSFHRTVINDLHRLFPHCRITTETRFGTLPDTPQNRVGDTSHIEFRPETSPKAAQQIAYTKALTYLKECGMTREYVMAHKLELHQDERDLLDQARTKANRDGITDLYFKQPRSQTRPGWITIQLIGVLPNQRLISLGTGQGRMKESLQIKRNIVDMYLRSA